MNGKPEWKCRWGRLRKFLNARLSSLNFFPTKKKGGIEDWQHYQSTKEDWCSNRVHPWRKKCLKVGSHIQHEDADNHYKPLWHSTETGHKGDFPGGSMVENPPCNVVVQLLSHVQLFVTPWTAACQAFLSLTISQSLPKFMSIESLMLSNHLIFILAM